MKPLSSCLATVMFTTLLVSVAVQTSNASPQTNGGSVQVPRLIRFSATAKDETGGVRTGLLGMTFALYKEEEGGAPLWVETQTVRADSTGHFAAILGSSTPEGLPVELFTSAEAQWLGVRIEGQPEQPRVLLVSVPYAIKAHEAETLAGRSISDFVLQGGDKAGAVSPGTAGVRQGGAKADSASTPPPPTTGPTSFTGSNTTQIVGVTQNGTGNGVAATTSSTTKFAAGISGVATATTGQVFGVSGSTNSATTNATGVAGSEGATTGVVFGVTGFASSSTANAAGIHGFEAAATGQVFGVSGSTNSTTANATGVSGFEGAATGQVFGVAGSTNSTGSGSAGVSGFNGATTGKVFGVVGSTNSKTNFSVGVSGFEGATTGQVVGVSGGTNSTTNFATGVAGFEGATTGQVFGVSGGTNSTTNGAAGVNGFENATSGNVYGVAGFSRSPGGAATLGQANATSGTATGVLGSTVSSNGIGVFGVSSATSGGKGVQGQTESTAGVGVAGMFVAHGGTGLILEGLSGSAFTNEFSVDASGNGFFAGNLNVKGTLTKGSGSFKIDHPLDPANRYLSHSFVESPDMMNVYNGNVTTDKHGLATVVLPDYFEALNGDSRYQLTVMGRFAQAIVAQKIVHNRFVIRTSKPRVEVSWQVTGIRHDAYANAYRIPVEEQKPVQEQGRYLHPELFGASPEQAIGASAPATTDIDRSSREKAYLLMPAR